MSNLWCAEMMMKRFNLAFHNVCSHHASILTSGNGIKCWFVCPYHSTRMTGIEKRCVTMNKSYHDAVVEFSSGDAKALKESRIYFEPGDGDGARELNAAATANQIGVTGEGLALSVLSSNTESRN